jgi:hypothetical protein
MGALLLLLFFGFIAAWGLGVFHSRAKPTCYGNSCSIEPREARNNMHQCTGDVC